MFTGVAFLLAVAAAKTVAPPPADLVGTWEVAHVAVNMADQPHWKYRPEDPSLIGREFVVGADQIRFANFNGTHCEPATWKHESWTWKQLVDDVFLGLKAPATPAEWRVKSPPKGKMAVHVPCWGQSKSWQYMSWLLPVGPDRAIMELDPETVLFLVRRKSDAKPKPSFSCAKASTPTEKAICESFILAGWDRSVSLAWQRAQEFGYDSMDEQKAWLRTRDQCAGDAACLEGTMRQRTQNLTYR